MSRQTSTVHNLFQVDYPKLTKSKVIISASESATYAGTIFFEWIKLS